MSSSGIQFTKADDKLNHKPKVLLKQAHVFNFKHNEHEILRVTVCFHVSREGESMEWPWAHFHDGRPFFPIACKEREHGGSVMGH